MGDWAYKLRVPVDKAAQIVLVRSRIHNFIIERENSTNVPANEPSDVQGFLMEVFAQDECVMDEQGCRRDLETSDRRNNLPETHRN